MSETTVELREEYSTPNPDELAAIAARGDHLDGSLVGDGLYEALDEIKDGDDGNKGITALGKFLEQLLRRGHFGPFEHPQAFFVVEGISRDQMAQITRHRHMSWDVQSMRYVDFSDASFTLPPEAEDEAVEVYPPKEDSDVDLDMPPLEVSAESVMERAYQEAQRHYNDLVEAGVEKEDARKVLPIGTEINMSFSASLRSLFHVFDLRVSGKAQDDTRRFTEQLLEETRDWAPLSTGYYEERVKGNSLQAP
jgi:thymidylate synthase, flavin-dependent